MSVVILYGSETGTAELVSDAISDVLAGQHDVSMYDMSDFAVEDLDVRRLPRGGLLHLRRR